MVGMPRARFSRAAEEPIAGATTDTAQASRSTLPCLAGAHATLASAQVHCTVPGQPPAPLAHPPRRVDARRSRRCEGVALAVRVRGLQHRMLGYQGGKVGAGDAGKGGLGVRRRMKRGRYLLLKLGLPAGLPAKRSLTQQEDQGHKIGSNQEDAASETGQHGDPLDFRPAAPGEIWRKAVVAEQAGSRSDFNHEERTGKYAPRPPS